MKILVARFAKKYRDFAATGSLSLEGDECDVATILRCAAEGYTKARFRSLDNRIKKLEQFHCEHEFSDRGKGCLESLFCVECEALNPAWREVDWPRDASLSDEWERTERGLQPKDHQAIRVSGRYYVPKEEP